MGNLIPEFYVYVHIGYIIRWNLCYPSASLSLGLASGHLPLHHFMPSGTSPFPRGLRWPSTPFLRLPPVTAQCGTHSMLLHVTRGPRRQMNAIYVSRTSSKKSKRLSEPEPRPRGRLRSGTPRSFQRHRGRRTHPPSRPHPPGHHGVRRPGTFPRMRSSCCP